MRTFGRFGLLLITALTSLSFSASSQVYLEDFAGEGNNAVSGTAIGGTWTTTTPTGGAVSFSRFDFGPPYGPVFRVNNTGTEGVWRSNIIDISALGEVALEIMLGGNGTTAADYVRAYYRINGGPEIMFGEVIGDPALNVFSASSAVVSGNTLELVIRGMDNSPGGVNNTMGFDNVQVTDIIVLYSRANSAWNVGTTWSTTGFAGASCGCLPDNVSRVIIGGGFTVTIPADGTSAGVEIRNTGRLEWTANNVDLSVARGGTVDIQSGGVLTRLATTASTIQFASYPYTINVAGSLSVGMLVFNGRGNTSLTNSGTLTLTTASGITINGGNGYTFNNSGTLNLTDMDLNSADITFNNSGTVNQTGNFIDVDAGSSFNNQSNGTWNWSGLVSTNVRLFANNNANTFNYNGAGQTIITPQDNYWHLTLSGSGAKVAIGSFAVKGNWTRSGTATYTTGGFTVTLNGPSAQTISAGALETFANLTINNSFATSPQVTLTSPVTVSGVLTMTDGNINLNGNAFTLSSNAAGALVHSQLPAAGWMYDGSLTRSFPTTAVGIGSVAGYYPLGSSGYSRPFFIGKTNAVASNGTITISYTHHTSATNVSFLDGAATIQRRHDSFWTVTRTVGGAGTFDIRAGGEGFTVGNVNDTRITRLSDATGIGVSAAAGGTVTDVRANRTGLTAAQLANNFYLASTNSVNSPLPIELVWFRAAVAGDEVMTTWKTAQEKNNHYFTVEKTTDFERFYEAGRIDGKGNSAEEVTYSFVDSAPFMGRSYYRLRQTDFDGASTFSDPVMVDYAGPSSAFVKVYPNPFKGDNVTLEIRGVKDVHAVPVQLYNQQGQKIIEVLVEEEGPGVFRKEIHFPANLAPGIYFLKAGRTLQLNSKVVVN